MDYCEVKYDQFKKNYTKKMPNKENAHAVFLSLLNKA